jgi:hypothetical protein
MRLADLATVARNSITIAILPGYPLTMLTRLTPIQQKAFDLTGIEQPLRATGPR